MVELGNHSLRKLVNEAVDEDQNITSYKYFGLNFIVWIPKKLDTFLRLDKGFD